ncbi:MAG: DUF1512 domain-containing protein [Candidatus Methanomethyliaceae archaeon]|nr:DUF1512 domain-containing protein [Candidatus Methanomethyliaceae archaeon]MDW7971172.1 DUF1512 domain-containing protein [Nitrososphaerota archaeon]
MLTGLFGDDITSTLINIIWLAIFFSIILLFNQRIQIWNYQRNAERATMKLQMLAEKSKEEALANIQKFAVEGSDIKSKVNSMLDFFAIEPVDRDPFGVLMRLEHILNNRRDRIKAFVSQVAPKAGRVEAANVEDVLEAAMALNFIFKVVRHFLLLGKKTKSLMIFVQLDMQLPLIMKIADAYYKAQKTFSSGKPIGDGFGPLVASKLMFGLPKRVIAEDIVCSELNIENRRVYVIKAEGPGGFVGKPGEAIKKLIEELEGKVARIFMIDAASKLEGEATGEIVEGVGAAIGDPGPEKYKIEEVATKYKIPLDAMICKMDLEEALTTMKKEIFEAANLLLDRLKKAIVERTKEGDVVIVAGIGNTIGIAQ